MAAPPCTAGTRLGAAPAPSSRLTQALFKLVLNVVAAVLQVINNVTKAGVSQLLSDLGIHTQHAQAAAAAAVARRAADRRRGRGQASAGVPH